MCTIPMVSSGWAGCHTEILETRPAAPLFLAGYTLAPIRRPVMVISTIIAEQGTGSSQILAEPSMKALLGNMIFLKGPIPVKQVVVGEAVEAVIIRNHGLQIPVGPFPLQILL